MTNAILELEGQLPLEGKAESGGDYVRLLIKAPADNAGLSSAARGKIEIDGFTSDVALENVSPSPDGQGTVLTLRLFKPIG